MQWVFIVFFFITGVLCIVLGLLLSAKERRVAGPRQYCAGCGWTTEQVQFCEFEKGRQAVVAPLCFECTITFEAIPVRPLFRRSSGYQGTDVKIAGKAVLC